METDLKKIVGQRLQLLRMEKNLTQEQMGEQLNLSTSAYCKIEYGETDLTLTRLNNSLHFTAYKIDVTRFIEEPVIVVLLLHRNHRHTILHSFHTRMK